MLKRLLRFIVAGSGDSKLTGYLYRTEFEAKAKLVVFVDILQWMFGISGWEFLDWLPMNGAQIFGN